VDLTESSDEPRKFEEKVIYYENSFAFKKNYRCYEKETSRTVLNIFSIFANDPR